MNVDDVARLVVSAKMTAATPSTSLRTRTDTFVKPLSSPSDEAPGEHAFDSRDDARRISKIRSVDGIVINHERPVTLQRGDLAIIQSETYACTPVDPAIADVGLLLKRMQCVDRRTFDLKFYEVDQQSRFSGHPNILALYSFWAEEPESPYTYKTLVLLMEEATRGDAHRHIVQAPVRPTERQLLRFAADMVKAVSVLHDANVIHGAIKPSNVYVDAEETCMLGTFGKTELDSARQTHQLFSKVLIGEAIPHSLVYWAPELLQLKRYGPEADMWAVGITLYEMLTGRHPFDVANEVEFRDAALSARIDTAPLEAHPVAMRLIKNLIRVDPEKRWTARLALMYIQNTFAVVVQRRWRAYHLHKEFEILRHAAVTVQATYRGYYYKNRYQRLLTERRQESATCLQAAWRGYAARVTADIARAAAVSIQARARGHVYSARFRRLRAAALRVQKNGRRSQAMAWRGAFDKRKRATEEALARADAAAGDANAAAHAFARCFTAAPFADGVPAAFRHLTSFEFYEIGLVTRALEADPARSSDPRLLVSMATASAQIRTVEERLRNADAQAAAYKAEEERRRAEEDAFRDATGPFHAEWAEAEARLRRRYLRMGRLAERARPLPLSVARPFPYTNWELAHEADNRVENMLSDDARVFRHAAPTFELALCGGRPCFVARVVVHAAECGPARVRVAVAHGEGDCVAHSEFECTRAAVQTFVLVGGTTDVTRMRIEFEGNVRGGSISAVRLLEVHGIANDDPEYAL